MAAHVALHSQPISTIVKNGSSFTYANMSDPQTGYFGKPPLTMSFSASDTPSSCASHATCSPQPSAALAIRPLSGETLPVVVAPYQTPFALTLHTPSLLLLTLSLLLSLYLLPRSLLSTFLVLTPFALVLRNDYDNFLSLGPGGTPSTFLGYCRITLLRLFTISNPLRAPRHGIRSTPTIGILSRSDLPFRAGPKPCVAGIAPQRQLDQPGSLSAYLSLRKTLEHAADTNKDKFSVAVSCFERNGLALFSKRPKNVTCGGEVCHVHHSDRSMHMCLQRDDIAEVLRKGWGERHPLSRESWPRMPVPTEFVMIYAPRDEHELRIVCKIIEAAVWFSLEEEVELEIVSEEKIDEA